MEITPQQWQQAIFLLITALTVFLTTRSRKDAKPEFAEKQVEKKPEGENGTVAAGFMFANTAIDMLRDKIEGVEKKITDGNSEVLDHLSKAIRDINQRFDEQDQKYQNQDRRIETIERNHSKLEAKVDFNREQIENHTRAIRAIEARHDTDNRG